MRLLTFFFLTGQAVQTTYPCAVHLYLNDFSLAQFTLHKLPILFECIIPSATAYLAQFIFCLPTLFIISPMRNLHYIHYAFVILMKYPSAVQPTHLAQFIKDKASITLSLNLSPPSLKDKASFLRQNHSQTVILLGEAYLHSSGGSLGEVHPPNG